MNYFLPKIFCMKAIDWFSGLVDPNQKALSLFWALGSSKHVFWQ